MTILYHLRVSRAGTVVESKGITADTCIIGRGEDCGLPLLDPMRVISRHHAQISHVDGVFRLEDLESQMGTLLDGRQLAAFTPVTLQAGSIITIGPYEVLFEPTAVAVPTSSAMGERPLLPDDGSDADVLVRSGGQPAYGDNGRYLPPPGLHKDYSRYLQYLPGIYHTDYMTRFLALLESLLAPIEWNIENFDLYLSPQTAPEAFLPWLARWFGLTFQEGWSVEKQRALLEEAYQIYQMRGTAWALGRLLQIYTGVEAEIVDEDSRLEAHTFWVRLPLSESREQRIRIEQLINAHKPAHTRYRLIFTQT